MSDSTIKSKDIGNGGYDNAYPATPNTGDSSNKRHLFAELLVQKATLTMIRVSSCECEKILANSLRYMVSTTVPGEKGEWSFVRYITYSEEERDGFGLDIEMEGYRPGSVIGAIGGAKSFKFDTDEGFEEITNFLGVCGYDCKVIFIDYYQRMMYGSEDDPLACERFVEYLGWLSCMFNNAAIVLIDYIDEDTVHGASHRTHEYSELYDWASTIIEIEPLQSGMVVCKEVLKATVKWSDNPQNTGTFVFVPYDYYFTIPDELRGPATVSDSDPEDRFCCL